MSAAAALFCGCCGTVTPDCDIGSCVGLVGESLYEGIARVDSFVRHGELEVLWDHGTWSEQTVTSTWWAAYTTYANTGSYGSGTNYLPVISVTSTITPRASSILIPGGYPVIGVSTFYRVGCCNSSTTWEWLSQANFSTHEIDGVEREFTGNSAQGHPFTLSLSVSVAGSGSGTSSYGDTIEFETQNVSQSEVYSSHSCRAEGGGTKEDRVDGCAEGINAVCQSYGVLYRRVSAEIRTRCVTTDPGYPGHAFPWTPWYRVDWLVKLQAGDNYFNASASSVTTIPQTATASEATFASATSVVYRIASVNFGASTGGTPDYYLPNDDADITDLDDLGSSSITWWGPDYFSQLDPQGPYYQLSATVDDASATLRNATTLGVWSKSAWPRCLAVAWRDLVSGEWTAGPVDQYSVDYCGLGKPIYWPQYDPRDGVDALVSVYRVGPGLLSGAQSTTSLTAGYFPGADVALYLQSSDSPLLTSTSTTDGEDDVFIGQPDCESTISGSFVDEGAGGTDDTFTALLVSLGDDIYRGNYTTVSGSYTITIDMVAGTTTIVGPNGTLVFTASLYGAGISPGSPSWTLDSAPEEGDATWSAEEA